MRAVIGRARGSLPAKVMLARLLRFLAAGLPAFIVAVALNWLLAGRAQWPKPLAYAVVLLVQTTLNFYACVYFVFRSPTLRPTFALYWRFVTGQAAFRALDWAAYTAMVALTPIPFLAAQLINVFVFAVLKYGFSASLFIGDKPDDGAA